MRKSKIFIIPFLTLLLALFLPLLIFAHSGRTDANGGHINRKTGEYHYHNKKSQSPEKAKIDTPPVNETVSAQISGNNIDSTKEEKKEETVYITKTGKKYHREGCRYLKSSIPLDKNEAIARGYGACKVCNP